MKNRIITILILLVFVLGIVGVSELVWTEFSVHNVCPKIVGIPACYIIIICLIVPLTVHVLHLKTSLYFIFTGITFTIALVASILEFTGNGICPKSESGTPLCYYSFIIFLSLILLKIVHLKNVPKNL